jgi:TRAP-type C4-dicarboxylate transport system permease small subunit
MFNAGQQGVRQGPAPAIRDRTEGRGVQTFQRVLDRVVDLGMVFAEIAITLMMLHITAEVVLRQVFLQSLDAVPEIAAYYYMGGLVFFSLAYVTRGNGHISAEIFTAIMPPRPREILEGTISFALGVFMVLFAYQTFNEAVSMTNIGEVHQAATILLPKWPPRWFLPIGGALMALYAFLIAIKKLQGAAADGPDRLKSAAAD